MILLIGGMLLGFGLAADAAETFGAAKAPASAEPAKTLGVLSDVGKICADRQWALTVGTISQVQKRDGKHWSYRLTYTPHKATAHNKDGDRLNTEMEVNIFESEEAAKPVEGQKVEVKYPLDQPMDYEIVDGIRREK